MNPNDLLGPKHPSRDTNSAVFVFRTIPLEGTGVVLFVEAKDAWQVTAMERIISRDNHASPTIALLAVIRDYRAFGTRNDTVEICFYDFLRDCVDPERIIKDAGVRYALLQTFGSGVPDPVSSHESTEDASTTKPHDVIDRSEVDEEQVLFDVFGKKPHSKPKPKTDSARKALCGLGYKRAEVTEFISSIDGQSMSTSDIIKLGCSTLSR